jgi:hypothetical protein
MHVTHAIDLAIDNERAKVVNDLWFTGCVEAASLLPRRSLRVVAHGHSLLSTDGEIAVLRLSNCDVPPSAVRHESGRRRLAEAFEAAGMDIARANLLTVGLLSFRGIAEHRRRSHGSGTLVDARSWRRPSVIEAPALDRHRPDRPIQAYDPGNRDATHENGGPELKSAPSVVAPTVVSGGLTGTLPLRTTPNNPWN